jgi:hypothetical protein
MKQEDKERYVRWQNYRITQFSFANNLFLTFSLAGLAFLTKIITDKNFIINDTNKFSIFLSLLFMIISAVAGTAMVLIRLWNFRLTVQKIKNHENNNNFSFKYILTILEKISWPTLISQILSLAIGAYYLLKAILIVYGARL